MGSRSTVVLAVLLFLACIPTFESPLTEPGSVDQELLGVWTWQEKDGPGFLHVGLGEEPAELRIVFVEHDADGDMEVGVFTGHASVLDGKTYLSFRWAYEPGEPPPYVGTGYMLARYEISGDTLTMGLPDYDSVREAVYSGTLEGEIGDGDWFPPVRVTESAAGLREFVVAADELFELKDGMRRLRVPDPEAGDDPEEW